MEASAVAVVTATAAFAVWVVVGVVAFVSHTFWEALQSGFFFSMCMSNVDIGHVGSLALGAFLL